MDTDLLQTDQFNAQHIAAYIRDQLRAKDVVVMDLSDKCSWTDSFVIVEGLNESHVNRMAESFHHLVRHPSFLPEYLNFVFV